MLVRADVGQVSKEVHKLRANQEKADCEFAQLLASAVGMGRKNTGQVGRNHHAAGSP